MGSLFDVYFRKWCSRVNQMAFHDCQKKLQNHVFSRIVHLATQEHHLSQLIDAPGGSFWLLEPFWASMVALGGSWRKYMKTIVLLSKTDTFHSPRLFWTSPERYILDHSKCLKTIALSTSGSKARKPLNQAWEKLRIALGNEKCKFCLLNKWFWFFPPGVTKSYLGRPELPGANRTLPEHQWAAITGALVLAKLIVLGNSWFCNFSGSREMLFG